jgi:hypothetical protein
MFKYTH